MKRVSSTVAVNLAVEYHAFQLAARDSNWTGIIAWGGLLKKTQDRVGVVMVQPADIDILIDHAARQRAPRPFYEEGIAA